MGEPDGMLQRWHRWDVRVYRAVASLPTGPLDRPLRQLSVFANWSKPWLLVAAALAALGGRRGRRAAVTGVAAIGAASLLVNQPMKRLGERERPDREGLGVPSQRWAPMPESLSFPSGHSASAAAFTVAVGDVLPVVALPLRALGAVVAFSRVYVGVHYPGDVIVGYTAGAVIGRAASTVSGRVSRGRPG